LLKLILLKSKFVIDIFDEACKLIMKSQAAHHDVTSNRFDILYDAKDCSIALTRLVFIIMY